MEELRKNKKKSVEILSYFTPAGLKMLKSLAFTCQSSILIKEFVYIYRVNKAHT
jgi:hypothetical protein